MKKFYHMKFSSIYFLIFIISFNLIGFFILNGRLSIQNTNNFVTFPLKIQANPHTPISINGNGEFTGANGVKNESALGTKDDPYIIENWSISTSSSNGIEIKDTTAYLIIRYCEIIRGDDNSEKGIYIYDAIHVIIQNNTIHGFSAGIFIESSHNITSKFNKVWDELRGITLSYSYNCTIKQNYAVGHYSSGIRLEYSNLNLITNNEIKNSGDGIFILSSKNCTIIDNYCHHNNEYGLEFSWGNANNTVCLNKLLKNYLQGLRLYTLNQDNQVFNNDLSLNGLGPIFGGGEGIDNVYNNTLKRPNEMQTTNLPTISISNSSEKYCRTYVLSIFDTSVGPYELVFNFVYKRNLNGNATLFMKANIYTLTQNYITNTPAYFMFDVNLTYNGTEYLAFGYRSDSTSIIETSNEIYIFPMCAQIIPETLDSIDITLNLSYELTSPEWATIQSNLSTFTIVL